MDKKKNDTLDDVLKRLKEIGIKKISSDTHITEPNIEAILNKEFDKLNPTKAIGFAKILEREYNVDLSVWRKEFKDYVNQTKKQQEHIFVTVPEEEEVETKSGKLFLIIGAIALVLIAYGTFIFFNSHSGVSNENSNSSVVKEIKEENKQESLSKDESNKEQPQNILASNSTISDKNDSFQAKSEIVNENNETVVAEENGSKALLKEENLTAFNESNETSKKALHESFVIVPRAKIWAGVIYLDDYKRKQFLTDKNITLDPSRDFLIVTGHGKFDVYIDKEKYHYDDPLKVRLLYKDGDLEKIDAQMFKTMNRGKSW